MSTWDVELQFVDDRSRKFWRARVEDTTLYINYGRLGTDGQTQVKQFGSGGAATAELDKAAQSKRKKGYEDVSGGGAAPVVAAAANDGEPLVSEAKLSFETKGRMVEVALSVEGKALKTVVMETFSGADEAKQALARVKDALGRTGWK